MESHNSPPATTNGIRHFTFDREKFTLFYHPWFLRIMTEEIQKYDTEHAIHLNPAEIFLQAEMYEFADWRKFLTSLGGSAHAGWHFSYSSGNSLQWLCRPMRTFYAREQKISPGS